MKNPIVIIIIALVILAIVYFAYDIFKPKMTSPCESIFQQTQVKLTSSLDVIKSKGEITIGPEKIQELTESAQRVALNLKTCCIMSNSGKLNSEEFLKCQAMGDQYQKGISDLAQNVNEMSAAKEAGNEQLADKKLTEVNTQINDVQKTATSLLEHSAQIQEGQPSVNEKPELQNASRINLLASENGAQILAAPVDEWKWSIDGKETEFSVGSASSPEAVYAFKDGQKATFDMFCMLINQSNNYNPKEFELFYGNESPIGTFIPIGKFTTQNVKLFQTPYQQFKFDKVSGKYFNVKMISNYANTDNYFSLSEFQLWGSIR